MCFRHIPEYKLGKTELFYCKHRWARELSSLDPIFLSWVSLPKGPPGSPAKPFDAKANLKATGDIEWMQSGSLTRPCSTYESVGLFWSSSIVGEKMGSALCDPQWLGPAEGPQGEAQVVAPKCMWPSRKKTHWEWSHPKNEQTRTFWTVSSKQSGARQECTVVLGAWRERREESLGEKMLNLQPVSSGLESRPQLPIHLLCVSVPTPWNGE